MAVETFGQWLKRRRSGLGLTQAALAASIGYAAETIQKVEADKLRPSKQLAAKLAEALELRPEQYPAFIRFARDQGELPDLPTQTAALHPATPLTRVAHHHNLPVPLTAFIGRAHEVATAGQLLQQPDVRLLTLTGLGGIGKTRLALQVAVRLLDAFPDGVWFVDLAPIHDAMLVASTIATTLQLQESAGQTLIERLRAYLQDKQVLLLLDNFEQVLAAGALVAELLAAAPQLKILVTSRVVLGVYGEYDLPVPPLTLPDPEHLPPLDQLIENEAVQLFQARAQAATGSFALAAANATLVAELCQRLEGLPLAIEMAAARLRHLPLATVLARLSSCLTLLTAGPRTLPQRQQTLRNTLAWSYDLLSAGEQRLFRRLGVFVGGWTLEAAEAVCTANGDLPFAVLDGLAALVDHSLVGQRDGVAGEPWFTMLETVREYALEQLAASGENEAVRDQHAAYYLAFAERAAPELRRAQQAIWLARLEQDHHNLRAALAWSPATSASERAAAEHGLRLGIAVSEYWIRCGYMQEGRRCLEASLARFPTDATDEAARRLRAQALSAAGNMAAYQGDVATASRLLTESLALFQSLEDTWWIANVLLNLNIPATYQGDYARAVALMEESLALFRELGDRWGIASALLYLAGPAIFRQIFQPDAMQQPAEIDRGITYLKESLVHFRSVGDSFGIGYALVFLGILTRKQGGLQRARTLFEESLALYRELGSRLMVPVALMELASLAVQGQPLAALEWSARVYGAAEALTSSMTMQESVLWSSTAQELHARLQAQLGEVALAGARAAGRAMSLEQAIAYALSEDEHRSEPPEPEPSAKA